MLVAYGNETKLPLYIIFQSKYIIRLLDHWGLLKEIFKNWNGSLSYQSL